MWANFHTHSRYCDGNGEMTEYITKAIDEDVVSLGFSSHAPVPFPCTWCMKAENLAAYIENIDLLQSEFPSLQLYKGLETDYIPGVVSPRDFRPLLDYAIGSIHFIEHFTDGKPWEIDGNHNTFLEGLKTIFNNNIRDAIARYFELTREMVSTAAPEVIGHLDKIKIQNLNEKFFSETDQWYKDEINKTLNAIADAGSVIEVNTRGLYQKKSPTPYPSPWILESILAKNIPVTLSSDAHNSKDLISQFQQTASLLLAIGFKKISILKEGSWQSVTLTPHGIKY